VSGDGGTKFVFSNYTADDGTTLTDTPLAGQAIESVAEILGAAIDRLDQAEAVKLAGGGTIPDGVGTTISFSIDGAVFDCSLAYTSAIDSTGRPAIVVTNHLA
jgi:hypothetical protein